MNGKDMLAEIERLHVQLAGCGVAAMQNTEEAIKDRVAKDAYGWSPSYQDVCNAVDREIAARKENGLLRVAIAKLTEPYSVPLPKQILPPGPLPEDPLVLAARQLLMCFPDTIPAGQETLTFNIPAYIVEELREAIQQKGTNP